MFRFLRNWFLLSIPVGILIGRFIEAGKGSSSPDPRPDRAPERNE
ncbi:hypothetical protein [Methylobacterium soli]|nr:hypothetical protein [Methylobacterium soli]GJE42830.1 hypothetical protein AEGHOMDF_2003 [Methylobacterium soli]